MPNPTNPSPLTPTTRTTQSRMAELAACFARFLNETDREQQAAAVQDGKTEFARADLSTDSSSTDKRKGTNR